MTRRRLFVVDVSGEATVLEVRSVLELLVAGLVSVGRLVWAAGELARLEAERRDWLESPAMRAWRRSRPGRRR